MTGSHESGNYASKEYGLLLFLNPELMIGHAKVMVDKHIGRSRAGLLIFVEGLYKLNAISEDVYRILTERYSHPLTPEPKKLTRQDLEAVAQTKKLERDFSNVISQWQTMNKKSRDIWVKRAQEHPEVSNSRFVVSLANGAGLVQGA